MINIRIQRGALRATVKTRIPWFCLHSGNLRAYINNKLLKKINIMELSEHILKDAHQALVSGLIKLPWKIPSAPGFFVASKDDPTILAFGSVMHDGVYYKIGVKRE